MLIVFNVKNCCLSFSNKNCLKYIFILFLGLVLTSCCFVNEAVPKKDKPKPNDVPKDSAYIQNAIDSLPKEGGTVLLKAKVYVLDKGIHINRSNLKLVGEKGTILRLLPEVNQPVILIGSDEEIPSTKIEDIVISDLELDGNKDNQSSEVDPTRPWIRNNGIDVRNVNRLWLEKLNIHNARSGALVVSWDSHNVFISDSMFHHSEFDGIALYDSEDILVKGFFSFSNKSAGISLDNKLNRVTFSSGTVKNNGDVGIFARDSTDLRFHNISVTSNKSHGCFLSNNTWHPTETGVKRSFFSGCSFLDNNGWGFWLASNKKSSKDNTIVSSLFSGNALGPIKVDDGGELELVGNAFRKDLPEPAKNAKLETSSIVQQ